MNAFSSGTMTAVALVLALAAACADPYVGTDGGGNLQRWSAQGQGVFVDLVRLIPLFEAMPPGSGCLPLHPLMQPFPCQHPWALWQD